MKNEELERTMMGTEDIDAPDMERMQERQEPQDARSWQIYYDDSTDPPTPWWFNPTTGVSTWDCPIVDEKKIGPEPGGLPSETAAGEKTRNVY